MHAAQGGGEDESASVRDLDQLGRTRERPLEKAGLAGIRQIGRGVKERVGGIVERRRYDELDQVERGRAFSRVEPEP